MTAPNPFPADALDANRRGELTDAQRRNLGAQSRYRRRNAITIALFLTAGAAIVWFLSRPDAPVLKKEVIAGGALTLAAFLVVRSITGSDALTRDLENGQVQLVEGAIGKRRIGNGRARSTYFLDVGDRRFSIGSATFGWLPQAGVARVYFLPLSKRVVNVEILPNTASPDDLNLSNVTQLLETALLAGRREANEARAGIAAISSALKPEFGEAPQPPPSGTRDSRALADAIVGTWASGGIRATFGGDGTFVVRMLVVERRGRWSVDAAGRLHADVAEGGQTVDAWIAGDRLTIVLDGRSLTLTREPG